MESLGWALGSLGLVLALGLIVLLIRRARRGASDTRERELAERERNFESEGLVNLDTATLLERVRDLEGFTVNIYDSDTHDSHAIPVTDELIEQARAEWFYRTIDFFGVYLVPRFEKMTKRQTEEKAKKKHVHYRECLKLHNSGHRIVSAREWAERVLADDQESLHKAWIAECVVFRANGDAMIVNRENNPILNGDLELSKEDVLISADGAKIVTRLAGRASLRAGRAIKRGVLRLKNRAWESADRVDVDGFVGSPMAKFLFRDQMDALAAFMRQRNIGFHSALNSDDLIYKPTAVSVTPVFLGESTLRFSRFDPLSLQLILREHFGQVKLNNGWGYCSLVTRD